MPSPRGHGSGQARVQVDRRGVGRRAANGDSQSPAELLSRADEARARRGPHQRNEAMSVPNARYRLRRGRRPLIAVLGLLVGRHLADGQGSRPTTFSNAMPAGRAQTGPQFLAANVGDLEQIAAGEQPFAASLAFFESARKSDQVFRYVIFNRDGYSQLVSDRDEDRARRRVGIQRRGGAARSRAASRSSMSKGTRRRAGVLSPRPMFRSSSAIGRSPSSRPMSTRPSKRRHHLFDFPRWRPSRSAC